MKKSSKNKGYDPAVIEAYKVKIEASGKSYMLDEEDENSDEYAHFYFVGSHEGEAVIFDSVLYTLRLHHESEVFEIAEDKAAKQFPLYKKLQYEENENGDLETLNQQEEEIGLYMAEVVAELEEDDSVKVSEHVELDIDHEFGIGLDVGLHIESVNQAIIERFVQDFNADTLTLDDSLYSFQMNQED